MTINRFREDICTQCKTPCKGTMIGLKTCPEFINSKIRTYTDGKTKVIAVGSYKGKPIRAVAKCHPDDEFDVVKGKELAIARCNNLIAWYRYKDSRKKLDKANHDIRVAQENLDAAEEYFNDAYTIWSASLLTLDMLNK